MAYTNETTHFGFPLPLGTDLTVPMDYNESLEKADTALFEAQTNAAGAVGTAGNALTVANEAKTEAQSATATANSATATANSAATAANEAVAAVAEAKDDALDMICAVVEETATAQYKHEPTRGGLNYYFRYNDILYKTTAVINVGETIVPNTNCSATNVATELANFELSQDLIPNTNRSIAASVNLASNTDTRVFTYTADAAKNIMAQVGVMLAANGSSLTIAIYRNGENIGQNIHGGDIAVIAGAEYDDTFMIHAASGDVIDIYIKQSASTTVNARIDCLSNVTFSTI